MVLLLLWSTIEMTSRLETTDSHIAEVLRALRFLSQMFAGI